MATFDFSAKEGVCANYVEYCMPDHSLNLPLMWRSSSSISRLASQKLGPNDTHMYGYMYVVKDENQQDGVRGKI